MKKIDKARLRELLFRIGIILKGLNGVAEIAVGIALSLVSPIFINRVVHWLTAGEISQDPRDLIANFLRQEASLFSLSGKRFIAIYLLLHGAIKISVMVALLKDALWAYPAAIVIFLGFMVYLIYQYTLTGGLALIALMIFDAVVIVLIWLEYRALNVGAHS